MNVLSGCTDVMLLVEVLDAGVSLQGHNRCEDFVLSMQAHACRLCCIYRHPWLGTHCRLSVVSTFATTRVALHIGGTTK